MLKWLQRREGVNHGGIIYRRSETVEAFFAGKAEQVLEKVRTLDLFQKSHKESLDKTFFLWKIYF